MFWSIVLEPGKKYSTVVENSFRLSMATLDLKTVKNSDDVHTIYVETDNNPRVILCHLSKGSKLFQCPLNHIFLQGTDLTFVTTASANIHLTGYLEVSDEFDSDLESDDDVEDKEIEDSPVLKKNKKEQGNKRKLEQNSPKKIKSMKLDDDNVSDEDDSDDEVMDFEDDSDDDEGLNVSDLLDDEAEEDSDDEDLDDEEEDDSEDEEPIKKKPKADQQKTPKKQANGNEQKTPKKDQKTPKNQKTPLPKTPDANQSMLNGTTESSKKKKNKEPKTPLDGKTKPDTPLPKDKQNQQQKLNGGVIIQDLKVGDGAVAKPGKNVKVYYIGRLKSTGKVFDSMQKGAGFQFGLQRGEVIKGWDIGIAGMKVGGKRKVVCPPHMAYGAKGSPPEIPPNSTLVFEVELKHVN
ncbi:46 kDa FK506-binding nuclear protein [Daktulosphaira vitifoliae]|uniref:46 kDa FK506-binding nuclear protein n=1 Tax=Daktulosphaira vitifoliae TaxID=58002 RepID=UPI0021A9EA8E|nr:46 kDa FK506-binding nuclear protein [Daktulosphaira vitifoliae]